MAYNSLTLKVDFGKVNCKTVFIQNQVNDFKIQVDDYRTCFRIAMRGQARDYNGKVTAVLS